MLSSWFWNLYSLELFNFRFTYSTTSAIHYFNAHETFYTMIASHCKSCSVSNRISPISTPFPLIFLSSIPYLNKDLDVSAQGPWFSWHSLLRAAGNTRSQRWKEEYWSSTLPCLTVPCCEFHILLDSLSRLSIIPFKTTHSECSTRSMTYNR